MPAVRTLVAGRYQLTGELGRGGMGVVWEGFDELLRRPVAIKELSFPAGLSAEERERLSARTWREARAVAAVDTPAAVRVFDVVEHDGRPWIVMELVAGRTLSAVLRERGVLPTREVARVGLALLDALDAAHGAGVLHRDVKPSNVLVGHDGRIALTDFGIATVDGDSSADTTSGVVLGSPSYVAPERLHGHAPTPASDLWSLGATLWTAAEGRPPYDGPTVFAVMSSVATTEPPACARCAEPLAELLRQIMDADRGRRPTPAQVREVLDRLAADEALPEVADPAPTAVLPVGFDRTTVLDAPTGSPERLDAPMPSESSAAPPVAEPSAAPPVADVAAQPAPRPEAPPARRRASRLRVLWAAVVVGAVVVAAVVVLLTRGGSSPPAAAGHHHGRTAKHAGASLPSGWTRYHDPDIGWSVGVPAGWTRSVSSRGTMFSDPAGGRYFLIATRYPAGPSAVGAWRDSERSFESTHADYARVRLQTVHVAGAKDAADWEFTYEEGGADLHALDHAVVVGDRGYAVYVQSHSAQWEASQPLFTDVIDSFRPGSSGA